MLDITGAPPPPVSAAVGGELIGLVLAPVLVPELAGGAELPPVGAGDIAMLTLLLFAADGGMHKWSTHVAPASPRTAQSASTVHCTSSLSSRKLHEAHNTLASATPASRGTSQRVFLVLLLCFTARPSTHIDSARFFNATPTASNPFCTESPNNAVTSGLAVPSIKSSLIQCVPPSGNGSNH